MRLSVRAHSPELFVVAVASFAALGCVGRQEDALGSLSQAVDPSAFLLPPSDAPSRAQILSRYSQLDLNGVVPRGLLEDAIEYFDLNKALIPNQAFVTVVDFTKFSGDKRFFIVDMKLGGVEPHMVAHGTGSDPNDTGVATLFSNTSGSLMSSLGFYLTADIYDGTHMHSMHIDGLSADGSPNHMANTNVLSRAVVVHEATYVSDTNTNKQGLSNGCFALDTNLELSIVQRLATGSLMYAALSPLNPPLGAQPPPPPPDLGTSNPGHDAGAGAGPDLGPPPVNPPPELPAAPGANPPHATGSHDAGGCSMAGAPRTGVGGWPWIVAGLVALRTRRRRR
jgi:L,D-transpeptidase-like protein